MKKTFGTMIATLRKEKNLTQAEVAEMMGVTDKAVSKWERDLSFPDINSLPKLAELFDMTVDELMQVFENAINTGYTIAWGADVSEKGFTRNGIGVIPDIESMERSGSDQDRWLGLSTSEKDAEIKKMMEKPCKELEITQEMRQEAYDNYETTDDHGMQIYGIAKDQTGKKFYMIKNSWGTDNKYKGTWYISENFVKYKTMNIVVHKDALPQAIKDKLHIK